MDTAEMLAKLRADAAELATASGHDLGEWEHWAVVSIAHCKKCSAYVKVEAYFGNPSTGGNAVARECKGKA